MLDPKSLKKHFPILNRQINGKTLVYLDNASTTQKPRQVIEALKNYYENTNANIHRGIHTLSQEATEAYEKTRLTTAEFINAKSEKEIVFTRGTTESINAVAYSWGETNIATGDEIIVSALEHHSNLVPWQELCRRKNAHLKIIPLSSSLSLDLTAYEKLLGKNTKLVAITGMSNVLGTIPPIKKMIKAAHKVGAKVLVDGAQSVAHLPTDVQELDCDFLAFSSHKMLGPTGVGMLYGKENLLENMPPFNFGGDMVKIVTQEKAEWNDLPWKFEAGTPNIADVIAFEKALQVLSEVGMQNIANHDEKLLKYAIDRFGKYENVTLLTPGNTSSSHASATGNTHSLATGGILSFTIEGVHPHDIAQIFDEEGVAIRSGHHCNMPLMELLKVPATARLSFYLYNNEEDIDRAEKALQKVLKVFKI